MPHKARDFDVQAPVTSKQPLKTLGHVAFFCQTVVQSICLPVIYMAPRLRPNPKWNIEQNVSLKNTRTTVTYLVGMRAFPPFDPDIDRLGDRLQRIEAGSSSYYHGVLARDNEIRPMPLDAIWYPEAFVYPRDSQRKIVLHLHGGAFIMGPEDERFYEDYTNELTERLDALVLLPMYRRAGTRGKHFPAQLQDALTSYLFLVKHLQISPKNLVLSGDAAGGNLALGLMKYLEEEQPSLPLPCAAILISPVLDLTKGPEFYATHPKRKTDYLLYCWMEWAVQALVPKGLAKDHPYVSPGLHPRALPVPTWVELGECEIIADDDLAFFKACRELPRCKRIELHIVPDGIHDTAVMGRTMGHASAAKDSAVRIAWFVNEFACKAKD